MKTHRNTIPNLPESPALLPEDIRAAFIWFIGSGMDDATLTALADEDAMQKALATKDL